MSITEDLATILSARYGEDVRQAIYDSISEGYDIAVEAQEVAETSEESAAAYAAAALASEQAAQEYMEQAEEYKDAAFSGTPDGYEALVTKVYSLYEDTADSFSLEDTVEGLALAHTIYGMSVQDGTPTPSVPVDIDSAVANFTCTDSDSTNTTTITTDLTLRALEVESTDDYNLVKDGKYYIADTLDWDEDSGYSITRRIGTMTFDGTEEWTASGTSVSGKYRMLYTNENIPTYAELGVSNWTKGCVNSNQLPECTASANQPYYAGQTIALHGNNAFQLYADGYTTADAWQSHLAEENLVVNYRLATPTSESLSSANAQALLGLKTYDEATSIDATGDVAPSIYLEYSKDRNTALSLTAHNMAHINALKIADLSS